MAYVSILGTEYEIIVKKYDEEEVFARRQICGYCDSYLKKIVICDMTTYKGWENESADTCIVAQRQTIRHEIVHAFFDESGLNDSAFAYDGAWARNEEMVDWIALQGVKIYKAWADVGAI